MCFVDQIVVDLESESEVVLVVTVVTLDSIVGSRHCPLHQPAPAPVLEQVLEAEGAEEQEQAQKQE